MISNQKEKKIIILVIFESILLVSLVYFLFYIIFYRNTVRIEVLSPYECGFDPYSLTRMVFSYRFYLVSILFIIFDVEISLILPTPFLVGTTVGLWIFIIFIIVLVLGLIYEYYCGSLNWLIYHN